MFKRSVMAAAVVLLIVVLVSSVSAEEKEKDHLMGLGAYYGTQICNNPIWHTTGNHKWNTENVFISYGWKLTDRWHLYLEGNIGMFNFDSKRDNAPNYGTHVFSFGASVMTSYDLIRYKGWSLFGECGVGLGYWTDSPSKKLVQPDILGLIIYGAGLKIPLGNDYYLKPAYRFIHHSSIPGPDTGANTHGMFIGIVKYF